MSVDIKLQQLHNYVETIVRVMQPVSAHHLITLYICTKFQENISKGYRVIKRLNFVEFTKGHNSIKNVGGVTVRCSVHIA